MIFQQTKWQKGKDTISIIGRPPEFRVCFEGLFGWCGFYCLKVIGETYLWWCRKVALDIALIHHFNFMYGNTKFFTFWTDCTQHNFRHIIIYNFAIEGSLPDHMIIQTKVSRSIMLKSIFIFYSPANLLYCNTNQLSLPDHYPQACLI